MNDVTRYDLSSIDSDVVKTDEGFLNITTTVSRTGVFSYVLPNGNIRRELRHPNEVFKADSLSSLKLKPVTNLHPPVGLVDKSTAGRFSVGSVGENVVERGDNLVASFSITHQDGISAVDNGRRQLSLGYKTTLVEESGTYKGERYDVRQTNIRYNHLALVDRARAGEVASIPHMDALDAVLMTDELTTNSLNTDRSKEPMPDKDMPKITLDGIQYDASQEVINALSKETARADGAESELEKANAERDEAVKRADTAEAERDETKTKLEEAQNNDEAVKAAVKERVSLIGSAKRVLDDDYKFDDADDLQIKKDVVIKFNKDSEDVKAKLEKSSIDYVNARFDSVIENLPSEKDEKLAGQRKQTNTSQRNDGERTDSASAREKMQAEQQAAWKPKENK